MATIRDLKFALVRAVSAACRPLLRVRDTRLNADPTSIPLRPSRVITWDRSRFTLHGTPPFWTAFQHVNMDAAYVLELRDVQVLGKGLVVDADGSLLLESTIFQEEYLRRSYQNHWVALRSWLPASHHVHTLPLINYLDRNYFHWMLESIGRLELVADRLGDASLTFLVDADAPRFVQDSITFLFDVPAARIVVDGSRRRMLDRAMLVSFPHTRNATTGKANVYDPELIRAINRRALERIGNVQGPKVNLLITRRNAVQRRIQNERALLDRFPELDLQVVALEELSFQEQVVLFSRAGMIIATHGAGLTNLLFARAPLVIELYPQVREEKDSSYFFQLTDALGIRHHLFTYEPANDQQDLLLDASMLDAIAAAVREAGR